MPILGADKGFSGFRTLQYIQKQVALFPQWFKMTSSQQLVGNVRILGDKSNSNHSSLSNWAANPICEQVFVHRQLLTLHLQTPESHLFVCPLEHLSLDPTLYLPLHVSPQS